MATKRKSKKVNLTDNYIKSAAPGETPDLQTDGLIFRVSPKGLRSWFHRVTITGASGTGEQILYKLGTYPTLGLKAARALVATNNHKISEGWDPRPAKQEAEAAPSAAYRWTLKQAVDAYCAYIRPTHKNSKRSREIVRLFEAYVYPEIPSNTRITNITKQRLADVLGGIVDRWCAFDKTQKAVGGVFRWVAEQDEEQLSHLWIRPGYFTGKHALHAKPKGDVEHARQVPIEKLPAFYAHFEEKLNAPKKYGNARTKHPALAVDALLFTLFTGARTGEVIGERDSMAINKKPMRWHEIDWQRSVWIIPGDRYKNGYDHIVPLSKAAIALLKRVRLKSMHTKDRDFVFHSHMVPDGFPSDGYMRSQIEKGPAYEYYYAKKNRAGIRVKKTPMVHGLRGTLATFGLMADFPETVISLALGHRPKHLKQDSNFDAYAKLVMVEPRRILMEAFAQYCTTGKTPARWIPEKDFTPQQTEALERLRSLD